MPIRALGVTRHAALILITAFYAVPFYIVLISGFKSSARIIGDPLGLPVGTTFTLKNFAAALENPTFSIPFAYLFSTVLASVVVICVAILGSGIAFWIARREDRVPRVIYLALLAGLMIPPQVVVIPVLQLLKALGLLFTPQGLIVYDVAAFLPFSIFVYVAFVRTIPKELDDAAAVDGAGLLVIFLRIILPLLRPATLTLAVLVGVAVWNDFISPQIILGGSTAYTVTTGIFRAIGIYTADYGQVFAYIELALVPMLGVFVLAQRYLVGGLTAGAVKG